MDAYPPIGLWSTFLDSNSMQYVLSPVQVKRIEMKETKQYFSDTFSKRSQNVFQAEGKHQNDNVPQLNKKQRTNSIPYLLRRNKTRTWNEYFQLKSCLSTMFTKALFQPWIYLLPLFNRNQLQVGGSWGDVYYRVSKKRTLLNAPLVRIWMALHKGERRDT